jgi:hypothetical protein
MMTWRTILLATFLVAGAGVAGLRWRNHEQSKPTDKLMQTITLSYTGTVGGLFQELDAKTGVRHTVTPEAASLAVSVNYTGKNLRHIQEELKDSLHIHYSPDPANNAIKVMLAKK